MKKHLNISYGFNEDEISPDLCSPYKYRITPFSTSEIVVCSIYEYELITNERDRKVYHLKLVNDNCLSYEPGYTIGVLPSNSEEIVNKILIRLELEKNADEFYKLYIDENSDKKNRTLPKHIPSLGTLRNVLLHNVDLNSAPKKLFLKALMNYTEDEKEKEFLSLLCSPKGSKEYQTLISSYSERNLLGLLETFPSCKPPVEILLEHLPPFLPRVYSISSSPLNEKYFSITFNVDTFPDNNKGVCAQYLEKCINKFEKNKQSEVPVYLRAPSKFVIPAEVSVPIIMIATGTGIAPFRGFLEHRHLQIRQGVSFSKSWLFYGCRDSGSNYLFKNDLKNFLSSGALSKLSECFSRESQGKQYVQDVIEKHAEELGSWILQDKAVVYVCGNFQIVLPAVKKAIMDILIGHQEFDRNDAELYLKKMEDDGRYLVDCWN